MIGPHVSYSFRCWIRKGRQSRYDWGEGFRHKITLSWSVICIGMKVKRWDVNACLYNDFQVLPCDPHDHSKVQFNFCRCLSSQNCETSRWVGDGEKPRTRNVKNIYFARLRRSQSVVWVCQFRKSPLHPLRVSTLTVYSLDDDLRGFGCFVEITDWGIFKELIKVRNFRTHIIVCGSGQMEDRTPKKDSCYTMDFSWQWKDLYSFEYKFM